MAYKMQPGKCSAITCADCEPECPNQAINTAIDPDRCTECVGAYPSPRCVQVCPVDCFEPDPEHRETKEQLLAKWRRLHPGREPAPGTF